ncbi:ferritin-like protein [Verrucomicrobiaceae bacterium 227]
MANKKPTKEEAVRVIRLVQETMGSDLSIEALTAALKTLNELRKVELGEGYEDERADQHVACLKKSLQAAVTLEFATIPPYLCALWSIKDELHPAAISIREVVQEEMLHMALACNMLASLGEEPQITGAIPEYPGGLPGGVHEGLIVGLEGLTKESLAGFLLIERPLEQVPIENPYTEAGEGEFNLKQLVKDYPVDSTIGQFYDGIYEAFQAYVSDPDNPPLTTENQVSGPLAKAVIRDMETVEYAINLIKDQGEGSDMNPEEAEGDLSHYYRFLEVYNEQEYRWNPKKEVLEKGAPLPWPEVWPMARVPVGGYQQDEVSRDVWYHLTEFDRVYSALLDQLQGAWTIGGQAQLVCAYGTMFDLEKHAKPLMQTRTPFGGGKTYGPCFRYQAATPTKGGGKCPHG